MIEHSEKQHILVYYRSFLFKREEYYAERKRTLEAQLFFGPIKLHPYF